MTVFLVAGAAGFIGRSLCPELADRGHRVVALTRRAGAPPLGAERLIRGKISPNWAWPDGVGPVDTVVHLAQQAHRAPNTALAVEPKAAAALARAARHAGASRFIYLSSIKAMGETTAPMQPFRAADPPQPEDAYGRGKLATELALTAVAKETGMELVIIRPPLVYGPGVSTNFRGLLRLAASGWPLPLGGIDNRRSLVFVDNLVDLIIAASSHPAAPGRVWLVCDGTNLSSSALVRALADGMGRRVRLFAMPSLGWRLMGALPGVSPRLAPLLRSLQVDDQETRAMLGWSPPVAALDGLHRTAHAFAAARTDR